MNNNPNQYDHARAHPRVALIIEAIFWLLMAGTLAGSLIYWGCCT